MLQLLFHCFFWRVYIKWHTSSAFFSSASSICPKEVLSGQVLPTCPVLQEEEERRLRHLRKTLQMMQGKQEWQCSQLPTETCPPPHVIFIGSCTKRCSSYIHWCVVKDIRIYIYIYIYSPADLWPSTGRLQHPRYLLPCCLVVHLLPVSSPPRQQVAWHPSLLPLAACGLAKGPKGLAMPQVPHTWYMGIVMVSIGLPMYCIYSNNCTFSRCICLYKCVCVCLFTYKFIHLCVSTYLLPSAYILIFDIWLFNNGTSR